MTKEKNLGDKAPARKVRVSREAAKKLKGKTNWALLVAEEKRERTRVKGA